MSWLAINNATSLALQTIGAHKMRALLTVLGIVIGTGTIIGVGAILTGFDKSIENAIDALGPNSILIFKFPFAFRMSQLTGEERTRKPLTYENVIDIRQRCTACERASPVLPNLGQTIDARFKGNAVYGVNLSGVQEDYATGGQVDIRTGRFFTEEEDRRRAQVAVIGADLDKGLFANEDAVGKEIVVDGHPLQVIGTMNPPASIVFGQADNRVIVPYFTMQSLYPSMKENFVVVAARAGELREAEDQVRVILRIDRHVPYTKPDNFAMSTAEQMVGDFRQITSMVAIVMIVLSSIGLLVGGIGVMNIMLVSVTERTKEIGVRKAIGATRSDIILQFLLEAIVLTALGGVAGIVFGWIVAAISRFMFPTLPTTVPLWAAVLGIIVSAGTGLFFGIWPASKAARLDPVEALRFE